jgi:apolipoprotein N-acyltransferase
MPKSYAHAALAVGAGFLVAVSLPPWGFWPLAFVGIALFEVALGEHPTRRDRALRAWLFAAAWLFPGMGWMWFLTAPGYVVAGAMFAGLHALAAVASPTGPWRVIARPAAHTAVEALRLFVPFGGVPLATLAIGQAAGPLIGVARVGGVVLITWVVFQIGFALTGPSPWVPHMARSRSRPSGTPLRGQPHGAIGFAVCVAVMVMAAVAPSGSSTGDALRVSIVQGGGPQGTHAIHTDPRLVVGRHLAATETIPAGSVDLVVWPENVVDVATFVGSAELTEIAAQAERIGAPIAVGITEDVPATDGGTGAFINAQVIVSPSGEVTSRYEKVRRVPFGEYMPMRGLLRALGAPVDQVPRDAVAGTGPAVLDLPSGVRLGVVISWEVFFGSRGRDGVGHGGQLIINPTNGSSYTGTVLQSQQVASSRLRAVENGRWVAQASPTGFSAFISDEGEVFDRTAVSEQRVISRVVDLRTGSTWYTSLGDWPFVLLALFMLAACHALVRRSSGTGFRRSRSSP